MGLSAIFIQGRNVTTYALSKLKLNEEKYLTHELELEVVVIDLKISRHYLYGVKCEVFIDHHTLKHVFIQRDLN